MNAAPQRSMILCDDGRAWGTGANWSGNLGDGTVIASSTLVQTINLGNLSSIAGGALFSTAIRNDGTVWAWGWGFGGELGNGTTSSSSVPVQTLVLSQVAELSGGEGFHTLALRNDGTVWTWGMNNRGQLGDGTLVNRNVPTQVPGLTEVLAVSAGADHSMALRKDFTVWVWGNNSLGQLGNGTVTDSTTPIQVASLTNVIGITAGAAQSVVLLSDGTVWEWGVLFTGVMTVPQKVAGLDDVFAIAAGNGHMLALQRDGIIQAWGFNNNSGQFGDGTTIGRANPAPVVGLSGVVAIAAGDVFSLATDEAGTMWAWGNNANGNLGDGTTIDRHTPVTMPLPCNVSQDCNSDPYLCRDETCGSSYVTWLSLPTDGCITTAEELCSTIDGADAVRQRFSDSNAEYRYECGSGVCTSATASVIPEPGCATGCFCLDPGEGVEVEASGSVQFQTYGVDKLVAIPLAANESSLVSIPLRTDMMAASDVVAAIRVGIDPTAVVTIVRMNACSGTTENHFSDIPLTDFSLVRGEALLVTSNMSGSFAFPINPPDTSFPECAAAAPAGANLYCISGTSTNQSYSWWIDDNGDGIRQAGEPQNLDAGGVAPLGASAVSLAMRLAGSISANLQDPTIQASWTGTNCLQTLRTVPGSPPGPLWVGQVTQNPNCNADLQSCTYNPTIWRVESLPETVAAGAVPDGGGRPGVPLTVSHLPGGDLQLTWGASCTPTDDDFGVYEGTVGDYYTHAPVACTTLGSTSVAITPASGSTYYLVVPHNSTREGSYGLASDGSERPPATNPCLLQESDACP